MHMQQCNILIIDDDRVDARSIDRCLRDAARCRFDAAITTSGAEGIRFLQSAKFDAALLDYHLPGEATESVLSALVGEGIPVVIVTGCASAEQARPLIQAGAQDYLEKSALNSALLERVILYALDRHRLIQELKQANRDLRAGVAERKRAEETLEANAMIVAATNEALGEAKQELENTIAQLSKANTNLGRKNAELDEVNMAHAATNEALEEAQRSLADTVARLSEANQALTRKNAELYEFTYVASHDIQEPLRKLTSFAELLQVDLGGALSDAVAKDLNYITDAARRMQTLVQDLLKLSRAGRTELKRERVSLGECVNRALTALAGRIDDTNAEITCDDLPEVEVDSMLLTQLYQNLIGNALKFVLEAQQPVVRITAEPSDGGWVLGVRDNGMGIAPEYAEQIFAPFKRLHGRGEYDGSGIGLAICRKTVERHGGRIWVESAPGKGAHFRFTVAADQEALECAVQTENVSLSC
jgi:signal transduction histidine kinase